MSVDIRKQLTEISGQNNNAYEHLKSLVLKLSLHQQDLQSFEQQSYAIRQKPSDQIVFKVRESYGYMKDYETSNRTLLNAFTKINQTAENPQEIPSSFTYLPDLVDESGYFAKLGIGFGEDETYRIQKSLCILSNKKNTKTLRLWGKILCTQKDYYVAQGQADGGEDGELAPDTEPRGTGVNKLNYWISTSLTGEWTELPLVTPQQIQTSRKIKYLFTGEPNKKILTNPIFYGTEAHLLKCQIVRINSTCNIIPKGIYATNADDPKEIQIPQNSTNPELTQLANKQNWVYLNPNILKAGRISHFKPEGEEQQVQKIMKKLTEKDPLEPRLKSIALDGENWSIQSVDVLQTIKTVSRSPKVVSQGVIGVKNLIWPGWTSIAWKEKYSSIYIGYGQKSKFNYFPKQPERVLEEGLDREENLDL